MQAYQNAERPRPAKDDAHLAEAQDGPRAGETPAHAAHTAEQLNKFKAQSTDKKTRMMHHKTFGPNSKGDAMSPSTR